MRDAARFLGRDVDLFAADIERHASELSALVQGASFLVIGGAGSIGQAVVKELFARNPARLHVVDLSENNLVELVRDLRSSIGYIDGDLQAIPLDCGSVEFDAFLATQRPYDYVFNLSALKHVRSEKDPFTLMRMLEVNVLSAEKLLRQSARTGSKRYFGVSTDKAVNPVSVMGATKRIMEFVLMRASSTTPVASARFANVLFSDGSLPFGFLRRLEKLQPFSAPRDVRRYFITAQESGELCLMSCLLGENRDIFFPKPSPALRLTTFVEIAERLLESRGYEPYVCATEDEARARVAELAREKKWPCYFFDSETSGEKEYEEFFTDTDHLDLARFESVGVIKQASAQVPKSLDAFLAHVAALRARGEWTKAELVEPLYALLPEFRHVETGKYLDSRM